MGTLAKLAWRNIWRNSRRTIILICAVSAGLIGILFTLAMSNAFIDQMIQNAVNKSIGHIGIFGKGYFENPVVENNLVLADETRIFLEADPRMKGWSPRVKVSGLMNNAEHSTMISIMGVEPQKEAKVSIVPHSMMDGKWLKPGDENAIVISSKTADRFKTKLGRKIILMTQALGGEVGSGAFRIVGIFKTDSQGFDKSVVYINMPDAQKMINLQGKITGVTIMAKEQADVEPLAAAIRQHLSQKTSEVLTWKQMEPLTVQMLEMMDQFMVITYAVFFIAMAFGILNTLLMAVNERYREIGIMLAIGTRRWQIVAIVAMESFFIAVVAMFVGNAISLTAVAYFEQAGINLASFSEGLELYGMGHTIYPRIALESALNMSIWTFIIAIVFSLYPAIRASRFRPVEALRRI